MKVLGHDTYIESFTDGLQVLRYNKTTAYIVSTVSYYNRTLTYKPMQRPKEDDSL